MPRPHTPNRCKAMGARPSMGTVGARMTTPWPLPTWNVNSLHGVLERRRPKRA